MDCCGKVRIELPPRSEAATRIWEARVAAGIRQRDLAAALGLTHPEYSRLENSPAPDPALLVQAHAEIARLAVSKDSAHKS